MQKPNNKNAQINPQLRPRSKTLFAITTDEKNNKALVMVNKR
jgi:hypothetical protein